MKVRINNFPFRLPTRYYKFYEVDLISLDEFVKSRRITKIDFMKIDAELAVLKCANEIISRDHPVIILGMHPMILKQRDENNDMAWEFLRKRNIRFSFRGTKLLGMNFARKTVCLMFI